MSQRTGCYKKVQRRRRRRRRGGVLHHSRTGSTREKTASSREGKCGRARGRESGVCGLAEVTEDKGVREACVAARREAQAEVSRTTAESSREGSGERTHARTRLQAAGSGAGGGRVRRRKEELGHGAQVGEQTCLNASCSTPLAGRPKGRYSSRSSSSGIHGEATQKERKSITYTRRPCVCVSVSVSTVCKTNYSTEDEEDGKQRRERRAAEPRRDWLQYTHAEWEWGGWGGGGGESSGAGA